MTDRFVSRVRRELSWRWAAFRLSRRPSEWPTPYNVRLLKDEVKALIAAAKKSPGTPISTNAVRFDMGVLNGCVLHAWPRGSNLKLTVVLAPNSSDVMRVKLL